MIREGAMENLVGGEGTEEAKRRHIWGILGKGYRVSRTEKSV